MNNAQLLRYSRHIMLPQVDIRGQEAILGSAVLLVGLGGLGSPVAMYLAAAGVGELVLVDDDEVEASNLQRQIIHREKTLGFKKVRSAQAAIAEINSKVRIQTIDRRLSQLELDKIVPKVDVVIDCSDNAATRELLNRLCHQRRRPLISGAAIRFEGQLAVFDFRDEESPCYRCLYNAQGGENLTCSENGVFAPLLGIVGSMQASEALKMITGIGDSMSGRLALFDALQSQWCYVNVNKDPDCCICASACEN